MSSKCGKRGYPTRARAEKFRRKAEHREGVQFRIYPCQRCGRFHLTSEIERRPRRPAIVP